MGDAAMQQQPMPLNRLRPGPYWQPTPIVAACVALCCPRQRSDIATGHRVSPRPVHGPPPATIHPLCKPKAAHCASPPARRAGSAPPGTSAVVGHCRTPYPQLSSQSAVQPTPRGWSSPGPIVLWRERTTPGRSPRCGRTRVRCVRRLSRDHRCAGRRSGAGLLLVP